MKEIKKEIDQLMSAGSILSAQGKRVWNSGTRELVMQHVQSLALLLSSCRAQASWDEIMELEQIRRQCEVQPPSAGVSDLYQALAYL